MILVVVQAKDQVVIDELSSHTDTGRKELIHPYKVIIVIFYLASIHMHADPVWERPELCPERQSGR